MKLTKCVNGHFYDEEKYSTCPHCAGSGNNGMNRGDDITTESFVNPMTATVGNHVNKGFGDDDVTVSNSAFGAGSNIDATEPVYSPRLDPSAGARSTRDQTVTEAEEDGKTVGFINWNAIKENETKYQTEGQKVTRDDQRRETVNPVVGWLVCISGSNYGKSFCLYSGKNFIGRDVSSNDVGLPGDLSISRIKHAVIIYEPRQRQFFAQPGDASHELFYLNNQVVLSNMILKDRDVLTLGQTSLVFVPFCDERHGWDVEKAE